LIDTSQTNFYEAADYGTLHSAIQAVPNQPLRHDSGIHLRVVLITGDVDQGVRRHRWPDEG